MQPALLSCFDSTVALALGRFFFEGRKFAFLVVTNQGSGSEAQMCDDVAYASIVAFIKADVKLQRAQ
ncbi:MAG: hypothetical protein O3B86_16230 [Planctomycetota bacterium]|nr:hypothetical protein [Planctomycetota bacterium]